MEVSWFTPVAGRPELALGAIVTVSDENRNAIQYIPFPLEPEPIDDILQRGPEWLIAQLPDSFPVFEKLHHAEGFMSQMSVLHQAHAMTTLAVELLSAMYNAEWRDKAEYGMEIYPPDHELN